MPKQKMTDHSSHIGSVSVDSSAADHVLFYVNKRSLITRSMDFMVY